MSIAVYSVESSNTGGCHHVENTTATKTLLKVEALQAVAAAIVIAQLYTQVYHQRK
jgi:hypothetical protein